jgi:ABC-type branched-subunit amino acid transport system substrate-binding protein
VEYYLKLGIKKIIIYDNNEIDGEKFEEVLKEYEINKKVEIIDIQGFESVQFPS